MTKAKTVDTVEREREREPHFTKSGFCSTTSHTQLVLKNKNKL